MLTYIIKKKPFAIIKWNKSIQINSLIHLLAFRMFSYKLRLVDISTDYYFIFVVI